MAGLALPRSIFNCGTVYAIPPGSNVEPVRLAVLKGLTLEVSADQKELRGENWAVEDVQRANLKIGGKVQFQMLQAELLLAVWPASAKTTGGRKRASQTSTVPGTPYQITVTNSATFALPLRVKDNTAGIIMEEVASTPAAGQFSVSAGVYTFAAADTDHSVTIEYAHTVATGDTITVTNDIVTAQSSYYSIEAYNDTGGKQLGIVLPRVVFPGLSIPLALQDFASFDLAFTALPDANGVPLKVYLNA